MALTVPRRAVTLAELRAHRDQIHAIATRYGIRNIRVFGSVSRNTATADSDLDLLVDVDPGHGYLDLTGFALDVEDLLHVFTQVATAGGLKPRLRDHILTDARRPVTGQPPCPPATPPSGPLRLLRREILDMTGTASLLGDRRGDRDPDRVPGRP